MSSLQGKKIILGITGSIAAYKSASLCRLLIKSGCEVRVIMTQTASDFITPLSLSTLSKNEVISSITTEENWSNHVELGLWADAFLIAPATANTMGKMAGGLADNMLVATYLSAKCPVFIAPAMDLDMWIHGSTKNNISQLKAFGNEVIPVGHGELASGLVGDGRMAEPEDIISYLDTHFSKKKDLADKVVLITAGPTREPIDPVRFIGNRSTGKMGLAIAKRCSGLGADVTMIMGPNHLNIPADIKVIKVESAAQMYEACDAQFEEADLIILSAAVADFTPKTVADQKIKKKGDGMTLDLAKTTDIAASLGQRKRKNQIVVGFALETNDELANAKSKLERKNFDFIVLNSMKDKGATFGHDTNKVTIISKDNKIHDYELKSKDAVARDILELVIGVL